MATPAIQTLLTDAQQVLNLNSLSEVRATMAAALANANVGTPLNPNLTTQQLWDEFYLIVRQPESDIESIITNQLMKFLFAPPAPGGVGANGQVIFNDGGVLAGDPQFLWNKTTNLLTVTGSATITGDLTAARLIVTGGTIPTNGLWLPTTNTLEFAANSLAQYRIAPLGVFSWYDGAGGTRMTLNSTGLGVGVSPAYKLDVLGVSAATVASGAAFRAIRSSSGDRCLIVPLGAGSGFTIQSQNAAESDFTPIIFSGSTTTFNYRTGVGTVAAGMTLDVSGNLLLNAASFAVNNGKLRIQHSGLAGEWGIQTKSSTTDGYVGVFYTTTGQAGFISVSGTSTTFSTTSDYRLKESVQPLIGGLARINNLKPSTYKWKADGSNSEGFIAHELAEVVPLAVTGQKDAVNADGSIKPQGVDLSKLVPILVAAIQELTAEVNALKNA